jgi:hypothetical protein
VKSAPVAEAALEALGRVVEVEEWALGAPAPAPAVEEVDLAARVPGAEVWDLVKRE